MTAVVESIVARLRAAKAQEQPAENGGWEDPIDIFGDPRLTGRPHVDERCLPPALLAFARAEGERLGVDPVGIAGAAIGVCSGVISDDWTIRLKFNDVAWLERPRLWVCLLAASGSKKSEQIKAAVRPVMRLEARHREAYQVAASRHAEDHAAWKKDGKKTGEPEPPQPKQRRIVTSDFTVESLTDLLKDSASKLLCYQDELAGFFGAFERYSGGSGKMSAGRAHILSAYEGGPHQVDRVTRGAVFVPNWSIAVCGGIQPGALGNAIDDLDRDGLLQRFMLIPCSSAVIDQDDDDKPTDWMAVDAYSGIIDALHALRPHALGKGQFAPVKGSNDQAPEIHAIRRGLFRLIERVEVDPTLPGGLRQSASKWRGTLARVSLVFHCIELAGGRQDDPHTLRPETVRMAVRFITRVVLPAAFGFYLADDEDAAARGSPVANARWIAGHILAHHKTRISARDIARAAGHLRERKQDVLAAMETLSDLGWTLPDPDSITPKWVVNPTVHDKFSALAKREAERRALIRRAISTNVADMVETE